jgi:hypothetical protein
MSDAAATLAGLHAMAWACLVRGVSDRRAPARYPALATSGADGWPALRTVVLRRADPEAATVEVHSDLRAGKIADLSPGPPRAALLVWDAGRALQIRLRGEITVLSGPEAAGRWARVPPASRAGYGAEPPPGTPIPAADAYVRRADPAAFAVLELAIASIDTLHLGDPHRRARFDRADGWAGCWLVP